MSFLSDRRIQDSLPAGVVFPFAGAAAPDGWLLCDGSAISRATYARLFASIGTGFGVGDGSTTFNLPNTQGVFIRGVGSRTISGVTYTGSIGASQVDQMQGHKHYGPIGVTGGSAVNPGANINAQYTNTGSGSTQWDGTGNNSYYTDSTNSPARGPSVGSQTHPANLGMNHIIKI
jgi:microcystin-dependent protein